MRLGFEAMMARSQVERAEKWDEFMDIPRFTPRDDWQVQLLPPFGGALARMRVWAGDKSVSVYFDAFDRLGSVGSPYWEIYPAADGDTDRFLASEVDQMVEAIALSFEARIPSSQPPTEGSEQ